MNLAHPESEAKPPSEAHIARHADSVVLGRRHMLLAYASAPFYFGNISMTGLLVPLRASELGASVELIGVIVGASMLVPAVLSVTSGAFADRFGARRTLVVSTAACVLAGVLFATTSSLSVLLVLQIVNGVARSTAWTALQTYITGVGSPAQRASITGRFGFWANLGPFVGPLVAGGSASVWGYQAAFLVVAATTAWFLCVSLWMVDIDAAGIEHPAGRGMSTGIGAASQLMRLHGIQVMLLLTVARLWVATGYSAFFPLYLNGLGFSPGLIGVIVATNGVFSTLMSLTAGPLTRRASDVAVACAALVVAAIGAVAAPFLIALPLVFIPSILMGTSTGITLPLLMTMVGESSPAGQRGVGLGLRNAANGVSGGVAPVVTGSMIGVVGLPLSLVATGVVTLLLTLAALSVHRMRIRVG